MLYSQNSCNKYPTASRVETKHTVSIGYPPATPQHIGSQSLRYRHFRTPLMLTPPSTDVKRGNEIRDDLSISKSGRAWSRMPSLAGKAGYIVTCEGGLGGRLLALPAQTPGVVAPYEIDPESISQLALKKSHQHCPSSTSQLRRLLLF